MTILHAATLENCSSLYNYSGFFVIQDEINKKINLLSTRYSKTIVSLISNMLIVNENKRSNFTELFKEL